MGELVSVPGGVVDVEFLPGASEAAICLVHPYSSMFAAAAPVAQLTGHPVVAVDPRGVGQSSPLRPEDCSFERVVDDLEVVRAALDLDRWIVWGMSGGSMVAQHYAHYRPDALGAVILDSAGACFRATAADPRFIGHPRHPAWEELDLEPARDDEEPVAWEQVGSVWVWRSGSGHAVAVLPTEPDEATRLMMPAVWSHDATGWLTQVRIPVLVIAGTEDEAAPLAHLKDLHARLPEAELVVVEGAGHVPISTHPEVLAPPLTSFLDRVSFNDAGPAR